MQAHHPVHDIPPINEGILRFTYNSAHAFFQPQHESFDDDFVNHIKKAYWPILLDQICLLNFGDQNGRSIIQPIDVQSM